MAANGYFQLIHEDGKMWMKVFPPEEGGNMFTIEDVMHYLDMISFPDYDEVAMDQYIKNLEFDSPFLLKEGEIIRRVRNVQSPSHRWGSVPLSVFILLRRAVHRLRKKILSAI